MQFLLTDLILPAGFLSIHLFEKVAGFEWPALGARNFAVYWSEIC